MDFTDVIKDLEMGGDYPDGPNVIVSVLIRGRQEN